MNKPTTKNNDFCLDRSKGPTSIPTRYDDDALSEDTNPTTIGGPSCAAVTVNDSVSGSSITPHHGRRNHQTLAAVLQELLTLVNHRPRERRIRWATTASPGRGTSSLGEVADRGMSSLENDAVRFRMVAARFQALMDHRERRLEEAMSDPQRRTCLEAMFPGMKYGDYETLLTEVCGMEEDDFQALLAGSRKRRTEEQNKSDIANGGNDRRSSKGLGPPSHSLLAQSKFSTLPPGTASHEWGPVNGGSEHRGHYYPPPGHRPAYPEQHDTEMGARGMNGREISRERAEVEGYSSSVRRGEVGVGSENGDGRGLPSMCSHRSYHQWHPSSSRPDHRDLGGHLVSTSLTAGSTGRCDKKDIVEGIGNSSPREPYYQHAYCKAHEERSSRPVPPPLHSPHDDQMPQQSTGKLSASAPLTGGVGSGLYNSFAHSPPCNQEFLPPGGLWQSGAVRNHSAPDQDRDPAARYVRQGTSTDHSARDTLNGIVHPRDPREGWGADSFTMTSGPQSPDKTAAGPGAPGIERDGCTNRRVKTSHALPTHPKRVAVRLCDLLERCGGNLDEVMVDPQTSAEYIFLGLKEKESRANLRVCAERTQTYRFEPQPPSVSCKSEERARNDVDRSFRRESRSLYTERELPNHHRSGGKPEHPHNPPTNQHRYSEMGYSHRERRNRHFLRGDFYYREPREGWHTDGHQNEGGLSANVVLAKRKVSEDPLPKYSGMSRVHREPDVEMANDGDGGYLMSSPTYRGRKSTRSLEGLPFHPSPSLSSYSLLRQSTGRPEDHNPRPSGGISPPQPTMPSDPAALVLPQRDSLLQQHTQSQPRQSQSQTPERSESTVTHRPAYKPCHFRTDSPETSDDGGGSMVGRCPPPRLASPEDCSTKTRQTAIDIDKVIEEGQKPYREVVGDSLFRTRLNIPKNPPVVLPRKGNKRETLNDITHRIPLPLMLPYFNYPLWKAAEAMDTSVATLKRLCRRYGLKRWPHRQISCLNRAIVHLQFQHDRARRLNAIWPLDAQVSEQMQELFRRRRAIIKNAFESDNRENRSQGRILLDSNEVAIHQEAHMAGDMTETQIVGDME